VRIDAANDLPAGLFKSLKSNPAMNHGRGRRRQLQHAHDEHRIRSVGNANPALADKRVPRPRSAHAIDKQVLVDKVLKARQGRPVDDVSLAPRWTSTRSASYTFDIKLAKQDPRQRRLPRTNHDGVREMPGGGKPLKFRYLNPIGFVDRGADAQFIKGWDEADRHRDRRDGGERRPAHPIENAGRFRVLHLGVDTLHRPGRDVVVPHVPRRCRRPPTTGSYNDAFYCSKAYDALYRSSGASSTRRSASPKCIRCSSSSTTTPPTS